MEFADIYKSCKRSQALGRGLKSIKENLDRLGVEYISVEEVEICCFHPIKGFKLVTLEGSAFFPKLPMNAPRGGGLAWMRSAFSEADIVVPAYYQFGFLQEHAAAIQGASTHSERMRLGDEMLLEMYSLDGMAEAITDIWSKRQAFNQFHSQLVEATKAYSLGLYNVAITGLLPCIEGVIRRLGVISGISTEKSINVKDLIRVFKRLQEKELILIFESYAWYPKTDVTVAFLDGFHERVQMFSSISDYILSKLYLYTGDAPEYLSLNRHGISHGLFSGYATKANYLRLFNLLSALSFAAVLAEGKGSLMHPSASDESIALASTFEKCEILAQFI